MIYNPPILKNKINLNKKNIYLFNDTIFGGTKIRLLQYRFSLFENKYSEVIYAGPDTGMAQLAIGALCKQHKLKCKIFLNTNYKSNIDYNPIVNFGKNKLNIEYDYVKKGRTLKNTKTDAINYVNQDPTRFLLPFGADEEEYFPFYEKILKHALRKLKQPKRMWLVVGSGTILRLFQRIWPETQFLCVQVGKQIYTEYLEPRTLKDGTIIQDLVYVSPEEFAKNAEKQPPYPTIPWYDAKLWRFVLEHSENNDAIYNVAIMPTVKQLKEFLNNINT